MNNYVLYMGGKRCKKILIIGAVCFLILPYQSALGISHDFQVIEENQTYKANISPDIVTMINQIDEEILKYYLEKFV